MNIDNGLIIVLMSVLSLPLALLLDYLLIKDDTRDEIISKLKSALKS